MKERESNTYNVDIVHLVGIPGGDNISLTGAIAINDVDQGNNALIYGGSLTYYPVRHIGIGGSTLFFDDEDNEFSTYSIFGSWFFNRNLSLTASYDTTDFENDAESDGFSLGAVLRF
ncbi:MAG: hypothetical protein V3W04_02140 [Gammaproteobacteria bacterium]